MKRRRPKPLLVRRIYADTSKKGLFYRLMVFRTIPEARKYVAETFGSVGRFAALCQSYRIIRYRGRNSRVLPECGAIIMSQTFLSASAITHECLHAVIAIGRRRGYDFASIGAAVTDAATPPRAHTDEESLCESIGWMVSQAHRAIDDAGLYRGYASSRQRRRSPGLRGH